MSTPPVLSVWFRMARIAQDANSGKAWTLAMASVVGAHRRRAGAHP